jgi:uncharacterized membrane protein
MIDAPKLVWGAPNWFMFAAAAAAVMLVLLLVGYWRAPASRGVRLSAAALKALGVVILALCLMEPLFSGTRARPGANQFVILADNSQSMSLRDKGTTQSRAEEIKSLAGKDAGWLARLGSDFDLRQYAFDTQLRAVQSVGELGFDGGASNLGASLDRLLSRYQGRPLAGVMLLTDGNATDAEAVERVLAKATAAAGSAGPRVPPIYPLLVGNDTPADDVNLERINITQTSFEDAPVTLMAQVTTSGFKGRTLTAHLLDEAGKSVEEQKLTVVEDGQPIAVRFRLRPEQQGVSFYRISVAAEGVKAPSTQPNAEERNEADEATLANNSRLVTVDRGEGPYRILYVSGRPNWEFKFLQRALQPDPQIKLTGLIRIAKREPKFTYLGHRGESSNPLFRGFDEQNKEQVEQYDQPVLVRVNPEDKDDLLDGFPKAAEDLFKYHAIVLDDLESEFFTQDQMLLLKEFVRQRGGGLLMLGGTESFKNGKYDRTPIGDLLPVYVDEVQPLPEGSQVRMALTREGWLEPWVRLRAEESDERTRLAAMPGFQVLNAVRGIKPGATVLARAELESGSTVPALVEQRFGRGRALALLVGDLWRWEMHRPANAANDLEKAWRQTIRFLVADIPQRVEVATDAPHQPDDPDGSIRLDVRVRDPKYVPLDNAAVTIHVTGPDGKTLQLPAEPSEREAGLYEAVFVPRDAGAYRAMVNVAGPDGSNLGQVQAGWTSEPAADEFRQLKPNRELLNRIAGTTGGSMVPADRIDNFVAALPTLHAQITEPYIRPMWHQAWVFLLAIVCLTAEWGLRRWKGLP